MQCVVTGCAGFIGSHLCDRLLADGHRVVGVDCFTAYYPRPVKERNLQSFRSHPAFAFHELDLGADPLGDALGGADVVFHLAAMPGLKSPQGLEEYWIEVNRLENDGDKNHRRNLARLFSGAR